MAVIIRFKATEGVIGEYCHYSSDYCEGLVTSLDLLITSCLVSKAGCWRNMMITSQPPKTKVDQTSFLPSIPVGYDAIGMLIASMLGDDGSVRLVTLVISECLAWMTS